MKAVLAFLFFLSGFAGLVYEVAWSRYLSLVLGNTTQAHTVVLAAFLAGLALGNYAFGKWSARFKNPLFAYAALELGVAIYCACFPLLHRAVQSLYFGSAGSAPTADFLSSFAFRAGVSAVLLIIPAFLMGGTFPVLIRAFTGDFRETQRITGLLYAVNSLGAVIGSAASSLWLIRILGLDLAMLTGAAASAISGIGAFALAPRHPEIEGERPALGKSGGESSDAGAPQMSPPQFRWMVAAAFLSGFAALVLEIVWFRFFALILGSTLYSFSLMLSAFILGIALGSFSVAQPLARAESSEKILRFFGYCLIASGLIMIVTFPLYPRLPYYFIQMASRLNHSEQNFWIYQSFTFGFCFILMLLPTFFSGAALPLASQWISSYKGKAGEGVGIAFSANLAGTLAGSMAAGLIFLPLFGIEGALKVSSLLALATGVFSLKMADSGRGSWRRSVAPFLGVAGIGAVLMLARHDWKESLVLMNPYFSWRSPPPPGYAEYRRGLEGSSILFYKDGAESTVAVVEHGGRERVLKINGKTDASAYGDLGTELLLGHLPMLLRPARLETEPTRALCVGYGSGISAGAALRHPNTRLDVVEISPEVMEAAPYFADFNHDAANSPNAAIAVDDAKSYLARGYKTYDVILSEPSNPRMPGVAGLFTREFFELCAGRLAEDGLMVQWFHLYSMTDETVQMILRTFQTVFPHVSVWNSQAFDMMVVGSRRPIDENFDLLRQRMSEPKVRADLARIGITDPVALLAHELIAGPAVEQIAGPGPLHTDYFPRLEFGAARSQYLGSLSDFLFRYDQRKSRKPDLMLERYLGGRSLREDELRSLLNLWIAGWHHTAANAPLVAGLLEEIRRSSPVLTRDPRYQALAAALKALEARAGKPAATGFLFRRP